MQLFNICSRKVYEKDGEKKTKWYKVGILKMTENGNKYIRLFHQPNTEFFVFEPVAKEESENTVR